MKRFGDVNGFLAQGAVGDEEDFVRLNLGGQLFDFFNQVVVDLETACRVENDAVAPSFFSGIERRFANRRNIPRSAIGVELQLLLLGEDL